MPRSPRISFPDAVYHVTSRGNGRAKIFLRDDDRDRFLRQLADCLGSHAVVLYAYVLMDNHFHLLVRTPRANLSQFMQRLNTSYALYARYKHGRPGHQFEARFKAKLVQEDSYLLGLTRYIHLNPIKIAACRGLSPAERLARLESYRFSSYPGYVSKRNADEFVTYDVLAEYGPTMATARRHYRAYVRSCVEQSDRAILDAMRASRFAIGDAGFIEQTQQRLADRRTGRIQDRDLALPTVTIDIETVDASVAEHYGIDAQRLREHGHRAGTAKSVAIELACRLTGLSGRDVGQHYGGITAAAVSNTRRKIRDDQDNLATDVQRLLIRLHRTGPTQPTRQSVK